MTTTQTTKRGRPRKTLSQEQLIELELLRRRENLPHLYGKKWYDWAWKFFTSTNKYNFLCAGNQLSKSSTLIRKTIHWATAKELWPILWPHSTPTQFWYLYPSKPLATAEFDEKWVPEFLPKGDMKNDPVFGWQAEYHQKYIHALHFNSGVSVYFKVYSQDPKDLQAGSVYMLNSDEEMPFNLFHELRARLTATNGYFHMAFTATLGQDEWRRTMEPTTKEEELFPRALKLQVSLYDCLAYKDGTKSHWTEERIKEIEMSCATEAEIQRRVHGKFVVSGGLKFPSFDRANNRHPREEIPYTWAVHTGVDIGTGGEHNHPAAIVFIAVRPDYKYGVVFRGWRGDGVVTTAADILEKYQEMLTTEITLPTGQKAKRRIMPVMQCYDWQARDFFNIATRAGIGFTPADKKRDTGASLLNTLFKLRMLAIQDEDPELSKLVVELTSLKEATSKTTAVDDMCDALRYAAMSIPWDFDGVAAELIKQEEVIADERSEKQKAYDERRPYRDTEEGAGETTEDLLNEWQGYIDG